MAGRYSATQPTLNDGDVSQEQLDQRGNLRVLLMQNNSGNPSVFAQGNSDVLSGSNAGLMVASYDLVFDGAGWQRGRTPNVYKIINSGTTITAGTGATVWTPTAGKKFRLMGWRLSVSAISQLIFADNLVTGGLIRSEVLAAAGITDATNSLGNGILSAVANNVLKIDATATCTIGGYVFGTEE